MDILLSVVALLGFAFFCYNFSRWSEEETQRKRVKRAENNILAREQARKNINAKRNKNF